MKTCEFLSFLVLGLALESGELAAHVFPSLLPVGKLSDLAGELADGHADLLHGVEVTQGHGLVLNGIEVDCDGEGDTALVCTGIALTDGLPGVINL